MTVFVLVDCNNFYASCERVFNPALENQPIVILSNNDGCIVARSNEAKKLGIPMGAPFFEWKMRCQKNHVHVFSSNYELYGDMSQRVMSILACQHHEMEVYSIDEAFLILEGFQESELTHYLLELRQIIKQWTGLPVSIGVAPTKTLAKVANYIAKKHTASGVFNLMNASVQKKVLDTFPVEELWGIGRRLALQLNQFNIHTASELRNTNLKIIRQRFSVVMEKMVQELRGISCLPLEEVQPRQQIISSRSFGRALMALEDIEEALSHYTATACLKLREQHGLIQGISVFLQAKHINQQRQAPRSANYYFAEPTDHVGHIISAAKQTLKKIFLPHQRYHKAGIMLLNITDMANRQFDLLLQQGQQKNTMMMQAVDGINQRMGKNTLFFAAEGCERSWQIRCNHRSPRYTTQWDELVKAR